MTDTLTIPAVLPGKIPMLKADRETLARWYAALNSYHWPRDIDEPAPELREDGDYVHGDPNARRVWDYIMATLTEREMSRGWWIYALKRTEAEWSDWWGNGRSTFH